MENKFKWDFNEISKKYKEVKKQKRILGNENDYLDATIENYNIMLNCSDEKKLTDINQETLEELITNFNTYMNDLDPSISKSIYNLIKNFGYNAIFEDNYFYKKSNIEITNDKLEEQAYQLFGSLDKKYERILMDVFRKKLVHVTKESAKNTTSYGKTYIDFINNIGYALINNNSTINTYSTFNHEITHVIETMINPNLNSEETFIISEARSLFIDILTQYKLIMQNNKFKNDAINEIFTIKKTYLNNISTLEIINHLSYINKLSNKKIISNLKNNYGLIFSNKKELLNTLNCDIYEYISGFYSIIIALHMLDKYFEDEEKGKYIFDKSMTLDARDNIKYLKELEFDPNDYDYINNLYKRHNKKSNILIRK